MVGVTVGPDMLVSMAYNEQLAERVRDELQADPAFSERKMFGGLCLSYAPRRKHVRTGVNSADRLRFRLGDEGAAGSLAQGARL